MVGSLEATVRGRDWEAKVFSQWGLVNYTLGGARSALAYLQFAGRCSGSLPGASRSRASGGGGGRLSTSPGGASGKGLLRERLRSAPAGKAAPRAEGGNPWKPSGSRVGVGWGPLASGGGAWRALCR